MTVREQIINNLYNGLQNITEANGYDNTIAEVRKGIVSSTSLNSFPVLAVQVGSEVLQTQIEGQQEGLYSIDCFIIGYCQTNDITASVESLISDIKRYFYKDENLSSTIVCNLFDINYIQGYEVKEVNPYLAYTNSICSFGVLLKIEYIDFVDPVAEITLNAPVLQSPANGFTDGEAYQPLNWNSVTDAQYYQIRVYDDNGALAIDQDNLVNTSFTIPEEITFNNSDVITWKVRAKKANVYSEWSDVWSYTINDNTVQPLDPSDISNNILWLRSDTGITLSGSKVTQWNDQSPSAFHVANSTDANRPTLQVNIYGSHSAVYFNPATITCLGKADSTGIFKLTGTETKSFMFTIIEQSNGTGTNAIFGRGNTNNGVQYQLKRISVASLGANANVYNFPDGSPTSDNELNLPSVFGILRNVMIVVNGTNCKLYIDSVLVNEITIAFTAGIPDNSSTFYSLGSTYFNNSNQGVGKFYLFENAAWNKALTASEVLALYEYHKEYYGI